MRRHFLAIAFVIGVTLAAGFSAWCVETVSAQQPRAGMPAFQVDTTWPWPPKLPNNWLVGIITFVAVDRHDHVWILHRSRQLDPKFEDRAAPPVLEFDEKLQFVQAWGGPGQGYDWPDTEHGLTVDHQDKRRRHRLTTPGGIVRFGKATRRVGRSSEGTVERAVS